MVSAILLGATSVLLGVLHGADPDHVVEMTDFVSQDPRTRRVMGFACKFGGGHTLTVLLAGLTVQLLKKAVPDVFSTWFEVVSGLLLVALGLWAMRRTWLRLRVLAKPHSHHGHRHTHGAYPASSLDARIFSYGPILTGVATGLAGSAAVMLLGPVASAPTLPATLVYILLYGVGVIGFMTAYGLVVARVLRLMDASRKLALISRTVVGGLSVVVGGVWMYRAAVALRVLV